jgi:hypothetical protein
LHTLYQSTPPSPRLPNTQLGCRNEYFDPKILRKSKVETLEDYRRFTSCSFVSLSHSGLPGYLGSEYQVGQPHFPLFAKQHDHDPGLIHHQASSPHTRTSPPQNRFGCITATAPALSINSPLDTLSCCGVIGSLSFETSPSGITG